MKLQTQYAAERSDLPHPLEPPAIVDEPYGPVPDYRDALVECSDCGAPLTAREYDADFDYEGPETGYVFCGNDTCRQCEGEQ